MKRMSSIFKILSYLSLIPTLIAGARGNALAQSSPNNFTTFTEWCENQNNLSSDTRHTVEVLLEYAETQECDRADEILDAMEKLQLGGMKIVNVEPISTLTNLSELVLSFNEIEDIQPLSTLTQLTWLNLAENKITDVQPLATLTNLTGLSLLSNQITEVEPLSSLTGLELLHLQFNQITTVESLSTLTNLEVLNLFSNPLLEQRCPVQPNSICQF